MATNGFDVCAIGHTSRPMGAGGGGEFLAESHVSQFQGNMYMHA